MAHHFEDQPGSLSLSPQPLEDGKEVLWDALESPPVIKEIESIKIGFDPSKGEKVDPLTLTEVIRIMSRKSEREEAKKNHVPFAPEFPIRDKIPVIRPQLNVNRGQITPHSKLQPSRPVHQPLRPQEFQPSVVTSKTNVITTTGQIILITLLSISLFALSVVIYDYSLQDGKWQKEWQESGWYSRLTDWWAQLED